MVKGFLILSFFISSLGFTQQFEGEIVYRQTLELKENLFWYDGESELEEPDKIDSVVTMHFLDGDHLTVIKNDSNTSYVLLKEQDTLLYIWRDNDSIIETIQFGDKKFVPDMHEKKQPILSYPCDSMFFYPFFEESHSFASELNVNNASYLKIMSGEPITWIDLYKSISLEITVKYDDAYQVRQRAIEVRNVSQSPELFKLPEGRVIMPQ